MAPRVALTSGTPRGRAVQPGLRNDGLPHRVLGGTTPATDLPRSANDAAGVPAPELASRRRADRRGARHLRQLAGVAYLVVVGEGGACRCPFGVRCQRRLAACRPRRRRRQAITRRTSSPIRVSICSPGWQVAGGTDAHCESGGARLPAAPYKRTPPGRRGGHRPRASAPYTETAPG